MKIAVRVLSIFFILVITCSIFGFSSQDANKSSSVSGRVAKSLIEIQPKKEKDSLIEKYQHPVRKFAHFTIYTLLGMSIAMCMCTYDMNNKKRILITIIAGALYAISDEIHQMFIPGRSGQVTDVLLDTFGVVIGSLIVIGIVRVVNVKIRHLKE